MKKRILSFVLVAVMMLLIVPMSMFSVSAETLTDEQGVEYMLVYDYVFGGNDNEVSYEHSYKVIGYKGEPTELVIPARINGIPVKKIDQYAFSGCFSLTSITIPNSVTSIDEYAFYYCESLTSITIPDSVTSIGEYAFACCFNLTSIAIGNSLTSIGDRAFDVCRAIESITVSSDNIVYKSVDNCLIEIDTKTLVLGCKNSVIPSNGSVTSIGDSAFEQCESLTSIEIPDSVTSIGEAAFCYCVNLTSIEIPNSVTSIGEHAFACCYSLTSAEIGNSVTSIGNYAFFDCHSLESITVSSSNTVYKSVNNCLIEIDTKTLIAGCKNSVIPSDGSVTSIGDSAFEQCESLTSIEIPDSVTSIGEYAFFYCESLSSIVIPDSVTSIGDEAFAYCDSLTDVYCEAESQPDGWSYCWNDNCGANVHWGYTIEVAAGDLESEILNVETNLVKSDYAKEEWEKIQIALKTAKEYSTDGKSASEIRTEIEVLENAILLNPKKAEFGDLNGDEKVTSLDYLFVKRACFGTYDLSNVEFARADINRDGQTNSADYLLVKRIAFGTYKVQ